MIYSLHIMVSDVLHMPLIKFLKLWLWILFYIWILLWYTAILCKQAHSTQMKPQSSYKWCMRDIKTSIICLQAFPQTLSLHSLNLEGEDDLDFDSCFMVDCVSMGSSTSSSISISSSTSSSSALARSRRTWWWNTESLLRSISCLCDSFKVDNNSDAYNYALWKQH